MHDLGICRSINILKDVEIERLKDNIKKLKAERTYRIKKELEKYNLMLHKFKEYRHLVFAKIDQSNMSPEFIRVLHKKKDSIKEIVLSKLNLLEKRGDGTLRLTEEQLIEHEMLTTNTDFIFVDTETQADVRNTTSNVMVGTALQTHDVALETEEYMEEVEIEHSMDSRDEELVRPISILITNENQEEIESFANLMSKIPIDSIFNNEAKTEKPNNEINKNDHGDRDRKKITKRSIGFRWRSQVDRVTQTEEIVFNEVARIQEEEINEWILKDRKEYLKGIQRQILHKKNELSRVSDLVIKNRSFLGDTILEESKVHLSMLSLESIEDILENEIAYLKSVGILNTGEEIESWKHGYYYGYDKGKNYAFISGDEFEGDEEVNNIFTERKAENEIQNIDIQKISEKELVKKLTLRNTLKVEDLRNPRRSTKIQEFNFKHKDSKSLITKKNNKLKYIDHFMEEPSTMLVKQAKMSRKVAIKAVTSIYTAALIKSHSMDLDCLAVFTYNEFCARYGQKSVVKKKLNDLLCSIIKYPDSRKIVNFAKLLGIGRKIGIDDYCRPKQSFQFLMHLMDLIQKSNLGIIVTLDDTIDYQFIPAIRAVECTKELLSQFFDSVKIQTIIAVIEKNSHPDPKKINKFGIIDQEFLQELLLIEHDNLLNQITKGIWVLLEGLFFSENIVRVYKFDFIMLVRHISPIAFSNLFSVGDEIEVLDRLNNGKRSKSTISVKKIFDFCFKYGVLFTKDIESFVNCNLTMGDVQEEIANTKNVAKEMLTNVLSKRSTRELSEEYYCEMESKYNNMIENPDTSPRSLFISWKVFNLELQRLNKD